MVTKKIRLKMWENNYVTLHAEKGEVDSRYIEVTFKDEYLNNLNLSGKSVTFFAQKPDKTQIFNVCTVNTTTNTATVELKSDVLNMAGVLICEFQIFDSNNVLLKVGGLRIIVDSVVDFNDAAEGSSSADVITVILNSIGDLRTLTTTEKSSLVGAVNELDSRIVPISKGGTGGITATEARTNLEVWKEFPLYTNDSGTSGTVTLSESFANYTSISICYSDHDGEVSSIFINSPNGKSVPLSTVKMLSANNAAYATAHKITILGSSITFSSGDGGYVKFNSSGNTLNFLNSRIKITKVIGYKY